MAELSTGITEMNNTLAAVQDEDLGLEDLSATICAELAAGLADAAGIKDKYEITDAQWNVLRRSAAFRNMLKEAVQDWSGDLNAGKRITKKAEIMLEDSLPVLHAITHNDETPSQHRLESVKQMAALAGRNAREAAGQGGGADGKATINIIIDTGKAEPHTVTIDATNTLEED